MKTDREFIEGIYKKAAIYEQKRSSWSFNRIIPAAAMAACTVLVILTASITQDTNRIDDYMMTARYSESLFAQGEVVEIGGKVNEYNSLKLELTDGFAQNFGDDVIVVLYTDEIQYQKGDILELNLMVTDIDDKIYYVVTN